MIFKYSEIKSSLVKNNLWPEKQQDEDPETMTQCIFICKKKWLQVSKAAAERSQNHFLYWVFLL